MPAYHPGKDRAFIVRQYTKAKQYLDACVRLDNGEAAEEFPENTVLPDGGALKDSVEFLLNHAVTTLADEANCEGDALTMGECIRATHRYFSFISNAAASGMEELYRRKRDAFRDSKAPAENTQDYLEKKIATAEERFVKNSETCGLSNLQAEIAVMTLRNLPTNFLDGPKFQ